VPKKSLQTTETVEGFKAFDKTLQCRGFQYESGKTYTHNGSAKMCVAGFHFCEDPLHVLAYYPPDSRFARVSATGVVANDSPNADKRVAKSITIGDEMLLSQLIEESVKYRLRIAGDSVVENFQHSGAATASGDRGAATASGERGAATASGYSGAATASGESGAATASGYSGAATASGYSGAATASGYSGAATASGESGAATASGESGAATASGESGAATASGYRGAATASGYSGAATASGERGAATASGDRGAATASGYSGAATASGYSGAATASGYSGAATASGDRGAATASGDESCAVALGIEGKAKASLGSWITIAEWKYKDRWHRTDVQTAKVDGGAIKPDTFYILSAGKFVEAA
jgi:hypothetical protein